MTEDGVYRLICFLFSFLFSVFGLLTSLERRIIVPLLFAQIKFKKKVFHEKTGVGIGGLQGV